MSNAKKGLSMALAALMTAGTLFNGTMVADAAKKKVVKKPVKKATGLSAQQKANYNAAVTAVVVLENGIKKYGLTKPENLAYSIAKSTLAKAAVAKVVPGSSKNNLLARIAKADAQIASANPVVSGPVQLTSVENPADMTVAEGATFKAPETVVAKMSDNTTKELKVFWDKTVDTSKTGETVLTGRVEGSERTVTMKVAVKKLDLDVTTITPLNLKQVKIEFNKPVVDTDKQDDIEDADNYEVRDKDNAIVKDIVKEVKLDDSKKFAILTFADELDNKGRYEIENNQAYNLIIDEDVIGKEKTEKVSFKDIEAPSIETVEVAGVDTVKVKFSEPIKPVNLKDRKNSDYIAQLDKEDFEVNNGKISIRRVELVNNNKEANIILSNDLKDKDQLNVNIKGGVQDYAGLGAIAKTVDVTVTKDDKGPEIVGFKNVDSDGVTLIFNKDIKFRNTSRTYVENTEDIYHTNYKNLTKRAEIDGKELKITFDTEKGSELQDGSEYVYVKSDMLESLWKVKNSSKLQFRVTRSEDNVRPEVVRVEQDKDSNCKVKVRFSEKVKEKEATDKKNYTIEDEKGKKYSIKSIKLQENDKEALIELNKDLDEDLKYKITVEDVEDKAGNVIQKVTKDFSAKDTDSVDRDDVKVTFYDLGTKDQKIVINFDKKVKVNSGDKDSALDLTKYTLVSNKADFNGKTSINLDDIYKRSIKSINNDEAVELSIPYYEKEDKSFNLQTLINDKHVINVEIGRIADANGNVTAGTIVPLEKNVIVAIPGKTATVGFDDAPEAQGLDKVYFSFDKVVSLDEDDVKIVAAASPDDVNKYAYEKHALEKDPGVGDAKKVVVLDRATMKPTDKSSATEVEVTLPRDNHPDKYDDTDWVLNYNGTYDGKTIDGTFVKGMKLYVVVVPSKATSTGYVTKTDTDYHETLKTGVTPIKDKIAPVLLDNEDYTKNNKYLGIGNDATESSVEKDDAAEYYVSADRKHAAIVLTFTEDIRNDSVGTGSFDIDDDFDTDDFRASKAYAKGNRVILEMESKAGKLFDTDLKGSQIDVTGQFMDLEGNKTSDKTWSPTIGEYKALTDDQAKNLEISFAPAAKSQDASVTGITVKGKATALDSGNTYKVELDNGTDLSTLKPADVVATAKDSKAVVGAPATADNGKTWTVEVTAENGTKVTYTVNVTVAAAPVVKSQDASVTGITVKGKATTLDSGNTYKVELDNGTDLSTLKTSDVVATAKDSKAVVGAPATADNGKTWTVEVTAENGTKVTYTVNVTVAAAPVVKSQDASVTGITVTGKAATVSSDIKVYNVELTKGTDLSTLKTSDVVATAKDSKAVVGAPVTADSGKTWTVQVTAEDGTKVTYTINVTVAL